ncbi:MAG: sel1 repeat family protein [Bacteroidales bacterium]|nr:sel1 repeat family protein [Bacteroidales bacterium]
MKKFGYILLVFITIAPYILFGQTKQDTVNWIKEYALKGDEESILFLANCFVEGYGIEKNLDSAIYWYKKIKKEELQKEKLYNLGFAYIEKKEYRNAINILNNPIIYNFDSAMFNLSFCYSKIGEYEYAYHFMKRASELGMKDANLALSDALRKYNESIEERNEQIRDSNQKAEEMESKHNNSLLYIVIFIVTIIIIGIIIFGLRIKKREDKYQPIIDNSKLKENTMNNNEQELVKKSTSELTKKNTETQSVTPQIKWKNGDEINKYIIERLKAGISNDTIVQELIDGGLPKEYAIKKVPDVENITKGNIDNKTDGKNDMLYGALWCIGGTIATFISYNSVSESGGRYIIWWGAIVFGGIQFFKGLWNYVNR